jgi:hypothetical protein
MKKVTSERHLSDKATIQTSVRSQSSMSELVIYHSLRVRTKPTSCLPTIQEFRDDRPFIITDVSTLTVSRNNGIWTLAKGSLVKVYVFNAGSLENWYAGVGIFPELQELPVGSFCVDLVSRYCERSPLLQMRQRADGIADYDSAVIENFLELRSGGGALVLCKIGLAT